MSYELEDIINAFHDSLDAEALVDDPTLMNRSVGDDVARGPVLEIQQKDQWVVVGDRLWNSWTGLRRRNGEDVHGPVFPLDAPVGSTAFFTGARVCSCRKCEEHVEPRFKKN